MVPVSLKALVVLPDSRPLWPAEFEAMVRGIEARPADRTAMGVLADWCDEHGEPELAGAWRWLAARESVVLYNSHHRTFDSQWLIKGLPETVSGVYLTGGPNKSLAGRVAQLAHQLARAREELAKAKADLD